MVHRSVLYVSRYESKDHTHMHGHHKATLDYFTGLAGLSLVELGSQAQSSSSESHRGTA